MIRFRRKLLGALLISLLAADCTFAKADTILLRDGSSLTGTILRTNKATSALLAQPFVAIRHKSTLVDSSARNSQPDSPALDSLRVREDTTRTQPRDSLSSKALPRATAFTIQPIPIRSIRYIILGDSLDAEVIDVDAALARTQQSSPVTLAIGANLNFLDGIEASNVYYDLSFRAYDAFRTLDRWKSLANLLPSGFSLGYEQGRLASRKTVFTSAGIRDSSGVRIVTVEGLDEQATDFTNLSFGVYWPIWWRSSPTIRVHALLLNEFRVVDVESVIRPTDPGDSLVFFRRVARFQDRVPLWSLGLQLAAAFEQASAEVVVAFSDQSGASRFGVYMIRGFVRENRFGITVSGEVRGLRGPSRDLRDPRPSTEYQVAVAKTFALDKLAEFISNSTVERVSARGE